MYNILICDDDSDIVNALKIYLAPEGYQLFEAFNGKQALDIVREHDIFLLISNSGKTRELLELVELARAFVPQIQFIVITGKEDSPLAAQADVCLPTGDPKEVCPLGLTPTTSTTVMTVIGDILVVGTMQQIHFTNTDYAKRHHGGYLGAKSREQSKQEI